MSGNEKRDAMTGKLEEKIPELAARDGIDACGGPVEKEECRFMEHGAAEGEALLPAAGKLRGPAIQIGCEAVELDNFIDAALQARGFEAVDAAVELQVFRDGKIVVEAEVLRHVADALAHGFRFGPHVQTFDPGRSSAERQKSGEHFDDGGLSAAVGAEETKDFAFFDSEAHVVHGGEVAEAPHERFGREGGRPGGVRVPRHGLSLLLSLYQPRPRPPGDYRAEDCI